MHIKKADTPSEQWIIGFAARLSFLRLLRFFAAILLLAFIPASAIATQPPGFGTSGNFLLDTRTTGGESRVRSAEFVVDTRELDGMKHWAESGRSPLGIGSEQNLVFEHPIRSGASRTLGFGEQLFIEEEGRTVYGHLGQDFGAATGTPVRAMAAGEVVLRRPDPHPGEKKGMGNALILRHDLPNGEAVYSLYGHLSRIDIGDGRRVSAGQIIGAVGETGFATGPHLHFEIKAGTSMPAVGGGYAGVSFSGTVFDQAGVTYNDPVSFIEGRRVAPEAGGNARVANTNGIGLRLRSAPGLQATIVDVMPEGDLIEVLSNETTRADGFDWLRVSFGGTEGWTALQYLAVFDESDGTPSLGAPTNLAQYHGGAARDLDAGETLIGRDAIFEARLPNGGDRSVRLEVELLNHDSGESRREPGVFRSGAGHARVEVFRLTPGDYGWRMRAVDSSGRASNWSAWAGGLDAHAFTVLGGDGPVAQFDIDPAGYAGIGETITFNGARSVPRDGSQSYSWEFSDGQTGEGQTIQRTFDDNGGFEVTLVVTDAHGRTDAYTERFQIVESDLHDAVDGLMDRTLLALDQLEARMLELADEVDFFENRLEQQHRRIFFGAVSDLLLLGMTETISDLNLPIETVDDVFEAFLRDYIEVELESVRDELIDLTLGPVPVQGELAAGFREAATETIQDHREKLTDLRDEVFEEMAALDEERIEKIAAEINAQRRGVTGIQNYYTQISGLPITFADLLREDEGSMSWKLAEWSHRIGTTSGNLALTSSGGFLAAAALSGKTATISLHYADEVAQMGRSAEMLESGIGYMWEGLTVAGRIRQGVAASLEQLRTGEALDVPSASIHVADQIDSPVRAGVFWHRLEFDDAWSEIRISNTGNSAASFWIYGLFQDEFSTVSLPGDGLLPLSRSYDIYTVAEKRGIEIPAGQSRTVRFNYLVDGNGMNPEGKRIIYGVMAERGDNTYYVSDHARTFDWTDFMESASFAGDESVGNERAGGLAAMAEEEEPEDVELFLTPLFVNAAPSSGSADYRMTIGVRNPFESVIPMDLESVFGEEWEILSVSGASVDEEGRLFKQMDMWPGEEMHIEIFLRVANLDGADSFPPVTLGVWDPIEGETVEFERPGPPLEVRFADERVELAVREALEIHEDPLTVADVRQLTELEIEGDDVLSLGGLEHASQLQTIRLANNKVLFLSSLSTLRNLREVDLEGNRIEDLSPLLVAARAGALEAEGELNLRGNSLDLSGGGSASDQLRGLREAGVVVLTADDGTFDAWRETSFAPTDVLEPGVSGPMADPFGDGVRNLLRYSLGASPTRTATGHLPVPGMHTFEVEGEVGEYVSLAFMRPSDVHDVRYVVETSDDLTEWTGDGVQADVLDNADGTETVLYRDSRPIGESGKRFVRLRVEVIE